MKITIVIEDGSITVEESNGGGRPPGIRNSCGICGKVGFNVRTHGRH